MLSLPFLDMVLAVVRRTLAGKNPWDPDRKHLHHRMLDLGHGHRNAVLILYMWAALLALGTVSLAFVEGWRAAIVIGVCLRRGGDPDRVAATGGPDRSACDSFQPAERRSGRRILKWFCHNDRAGST